MGSASNMTNYFLKPKLIPADEMIDDRARFTRNTQQPVVSIKKKEANLPKIES